MNQIQRTLSKFGLTANETTVYLETIKHEETSPFELSRLTKIPRTTVYDILMSLSLKGLITLTQSDGFTKHQTRIKAKNPSELRNILHQKQQDLISLEIDILDILPQIKQTYQKKEAQADFRFYPGIQGAEEVYYQSYNSDVRAPVIVFNNLMPVDAFGRKKVNQDAIQGTAELVKKGVRIRHLIPYTEWTRHALSYQFGRDPNYIFAREMRYIDNPVFDLHQRTTIQSNRITICCIKGDEAWGLIINSPSLASTLTSIFELLWVQATPVTPAFVKSHGENLFLKAEISRSQKHN